MPPTPAERLPRDVRVLGATSLLNDVASEMIAPVLPVLLTTTLGAGPAALGLIEGLADAAASFLKYLSGRWSDRQGRRRGFVVAGYTLSNAVRPVIGLVGSWIPVLGLRFADRVGKGVRTAPRDALIAASVAEAGRGRAFGFHRAMDHLGAMIGPLVAFVLLQADVSLARVILWSAVPGAAAVLVVGFGLRRESAPMPRLLPATELVPRLRRVIGAAALLAFATVPDAFLVLWAYEGGLAVVWLPLLWAAAHAVRSPVVQMAGRFSDRFGRRTVVTVGWMLRVAMLVVLAAVPAGGISTWLIFLGYAATTAATEGVERAWIGDMADPAQQATAFGAFHMATGMAVLPGAVLLGGIWEAFGSSAAWFLSATLTAAATLLLLYGTRVRDE